MMGYYYEKALRCKLLADYYQHQQRQDVAAQYQQRYIRAMERVIRCPSLSEKTRNSRNAEKISLLDGVEESSEAAPISSDVPCPARRVHFLHAATRWAQLGIDGMVGEQDIFRNAIFGQPMRGAGELTGEQTVSLFRTGDRSQPLLQTRCSFSPPARQILVFYDPPCYWEEGPCLRHIIQAEELVAGHLHLQLAHFSPNAPVFRVLIRDGRCWSIRMCPGEVTSAVSLPAGFVCWTVQECATGRVLYTLQHVQLRAKQVAMGFIVGQVGGFPALRMVFV